ncbi:hypothetical protein C0993_002000 [Termitomyces sp. T159_Od127]|nr:hypothetical protein C0993_002000 [Termitomyces sp. T159_Od127]
MNNDDTRKRKAAHAPSISSKKHKTDTATTSRVTLDAPTRPTTRSISKIQPASPAQVHSTHRRDPSPGASQSTADTHRTRLKTGPLKAKKRFRNLSEDRTPSSTGGLSQWAAEMQREKLRHIVDSQSSPRTSHTKKRSRAPPKPPPSAYSYYLDVRSLSHKEIRA